MTLATTAFDSADYLGSPEAIEAYLEDALESGHVALIAHALGVVARARGMTQLARQTGLSRESLYRTLSAEGNPELGTVLKVMQTLGLRLSVAATSS